MAYHIQVGLAPFKEVLSTTRSKSLGFGISHPSLSSKSPIEDVAKSTSERIAEAVYITVLRDITLPAVRGSNELTAGGSCTSQLYVSASGDPCRCHSLQLNVFTSWLTRAGHSWQMGAVGWLEDEKGYCFLLPYKRIRFIG